MAIGAGEFEAQGLCTGLNAPSAALKNDLRTKTAR
jgi:hypothetical protein